MDDKLSRDLERACKQHPQETYDVTVESLEMQSLGPFEKLSFKMEIESLPQYFVYEGTLTGEEILELNEWESVTSIALQ